MNSKYFDFKHVCIEIGTMCQNSDSTKQNFKSFRSVLDALGDGSRHNRNHRSRSRRCERVGQGSGLERAGQGSRLGEARGSDRLDNAASAGGSNDASDLGRGFGRRFRGRTQSAKRVGHWL